MSRESDAEIGVLLPSGCRVTHGAGANMKKPYQDLPLIMHELHAGGLAGGRTRAFSGQFGFVPFSTDFRLPRHVHIAKSGEAGADELVSERILVVNGVGLVELNGVVHVVAPGSLIHIEPGIPHTWTACPSGVILPDSMVSDGSFLMIYEYGAPTGFFPTAATKPLTCIADYERWDGDIEQIRFPTLAARELAASASFVWGTELRTDLRLQT